MLDPYTYGRYRCAENLTKILNELDNPKITRKVGSYLHEKCKIIKHVMSATDPNVRKYLVSMLLYDINTNFLLVVPKKVESNTKSVAVTHLRQLNREAGYYE